MRPPVVDINSVQKILIVKMSALGDIIHALPVAHALKNSFPHLQLSWVVEEPFFALVSGNPCLEQIFTIPKIRSKNLRSPNFYSDYFGRIRKIREQQFDVVLDLQGLTKSAMVAVASGAKVRLAYHWLREVAKFLEYPIPKRTESIHIVDQYLDVARYLGANTDNPKFPFYVSPDDERAVDQMLQAGGLQPNQPFISINPASAQAIKQWNSANYAQLIDVLHDRLQVITVLVTADQKVAQAVQAHSKRPFINLVGKTSLKQLAEVLKRSTVHLCGDTGSAHLAAMFERPVVELVGPTDADRICPFGQRQGVIQHKEHCGKQCNWHHCEFVQPHCLAAITVEEVLQKIEIALKAG